MTALEEIKKAEHERIWLEPAGAPDRCWCQDNQWGDEGVEYVLASTLDGAHAEENRIRTIALDMQAGYREATARAEAAEAEVKRLTESRDGYKRGRDSIQAEYDRLRASHSDEIEALTDKIEGLSADLDSAVGVAFNRGAHEWVRMNYPDRFDKLSRTALTSTGGEHHAE